MLSPEECYRISRAVYASSFSTLDPSYGDDLVQEGAIGIWKGQAAYRAELASESTFASRLARNAMIDALRRILRPRSHETSVADFTLLDEPINEDLSELEATETWRKIEDGAGSDRLSRWRAIVSGRLSGLADSEIARRLGISKASLSREGARLAGHAAAALGLATLQPAPQPVVLPLDR
ncbi:MAG: sigma-70 family RNA polymerase sigma factor [Dehalococcoidia bacterium]